MSLPYSTIVPISAVVDTPSFTVEKKHMLLVMDNDLIPAREPYLVFSGASAVSDFESYFGYGIPEAKAVEKYFGFLSKGGNSPEKLVVARWYKTPAKAMIKGEKITASIDSLSSISSGSFKLDMGGINAEVVADLRDSSSYSDIAEKVQTALQTSFNGYTCVFDSVTEGLIIRSADTGASVKVNGVSAGETGTDISSVLGLLNAELSDGVASETYAQFCDRIYNANSSGYSITTLESLSEDEIVDAVRWLNGSSGEQTRYTEVRMVFNFSDKETAKAVSSTLSVNSFTGYVITYDPHNEYVNILDCSICATIDFEVSNGAINFNFQPAVGYTSVTTLGTVIDYQQGMTNSSLINELNNAKISCVYSIGFGTQEQVLYGFGLMAGDFGTEDVQVNESALEKDLQTSILNALVSLNKVKLHGSDAKTLVSSLIATPLDKYKVNGAIAMNGTLSNTDKVAIAQATGNPDASGSVEQNGYYFQIQNITAEDVANKRIRVLICYLCGGVVNKVRIINRVYGA